MTFDEYVRYTGSAENLAREAGWWLGPQRQDFSGLLRAWYTRVQLSAAQMDAIRWEQSPFFLLWASAAIDEMIAALHERLLTGPAG
jgi:hypothetical protein